MNSFRKLKSNKLLLYIAIASAVITAAESLMYYGSENDLLLQLLQTLENTVKAFTFSSPISLGDARAFMT